MPGTDPRAGRARSSRPANGAAGAVDGCSIRSGVKAPLLVLVAGVEEGAQVVVGLECAAAHEREHLSARLAGGVDEGVGLSEAEVLVGRFPDGRGVLRGLCLGESDGRVGVTVCQSVMRSSYRWVGEEVSAGGQPLRKRQRTANQEDSDSLLPVGPYDDRLPGAPQPEGLPELGGTS